MSSRMCTMAFRRPLHIRRTFAAWVWATLLLSLADQSSCPAHSTAAPVGTPSSIRDILYNPHRPTNTHTSTLESLETATHLTIRISTSDLQSRQLLDQTIQLAAFEQFNNHKTGMLYNVSVPSAALSGTFQAIRLRSGSLRRYGVAINEFKIPRGCEVNPAPERILLVYSQIVNTSLFKGLPDNFVLASPVLSVLVYDAMNLDSTQPAEQVTVSTTIDPITIQFASNDNVKCASFDEHSTDVNYTGLIGGVCQVRHLGAFALVSNVSAPSPSQFSPPMAVSPHLPSSSSNTWRIVVGSVVGGLGLLLIVSLLAFGIGNQRKKAKFARMEYQADEGETLQTTIIRNSRAPAAGDTRTQPTLEREYTV